MLIRNASRLRVGTGTPAIKTALAAVSAAQLREWVEKISIPRHCHFNSEANRVTADWLAREFADWGYEVSFQGRFRNVVATPPVLGKKIILVGAHYDSVPETPGADDNGSAVAAMLGCAQQCAAFFPGIAVVFVAFNCEEDGLRGSTEWVQHCLPGAGYEVACAHVLEMVGFASSEPGSQKIPPGLPISLPDRGDFIGLLGNRHASRVMREALLATRTHVPARAAYGVEVMLGLEKWFPVLQRSDHAPFWKAGIPALMWTDTSEFRNPHYHQASDLPDTLDYEFLSDVTRAVTATVLTQAEVLMTQA
ncbi:MAG: M28 family peptidase [Prosthecobacter sp.]